MDKLALFRLLNEKQAKIAEQVIGNWGSAELDACIVVLLIDAQRLALKPEIVEALDRLRHLHSEEFPRFVRQEIQVVAQMASPAPAPAIAEDPDFQLVSARFPHIGAKIAATWATHEFRPYANTLFNDSSRLNRQGFPGDILMALFRLAELHDEKYPELRGRARDIWDS